MEKSDNIYITTPIFYVNAAPHIGSLYTCILADCYVRAYKFLGKNVKILTGTDEHGNKVEKSARDSNKSPMEFCNNVSKTFREMMTDFNLLCSYNQFENEKNFIRTTNGRNLQTGEIDDSQKYSHIKFVQQVWSRMVENGWIYKGKYSGYYSIRDEAFYGEEELIDGKAPTGAEVKFVTEECYFYKLSAFQEILLKFLIDAQKNEKYLVPSERLSELIAFVSGTDLKSALNGEFKKGHLQDIPVSRLRTENFTWGIPVPGDEKHLVYVWLDALFNYMSTFSIDLKLNLDEAYKEWKNHKTFQLMGKDIIKFHVLYWPTFLYAINFKIEDLQKSTNLDDFQSGMYHKVLGHGWWTNEGQKISKSLGNIVDPYKEIEWLKSMNISEEIAIDYLKFFMVGYFSASSDGDYSRNSLKEFVNSNLVNNIGNLIQRIISLLEKFREKVGLQIEFSYSLPISDREIAIEKCLEAFDLVAISRIFLDEGNNCNKMIEENKLWTLIDGKDENSVKFLNNVTNIFGGILTIAQTLSIICPTIGGKILEKIGCDMNSKEFPFENLKMIKSDGIFLPRIE